MSNLGSRRLKVALVGCGGFANAALVPAMRMAPIDVVAVCDRDEGRANATADVTGARASYSALDVLLARESVDAVVMAVGPTVYPALAIQAMRVGVNVFIEKPPAVTVEEAQAMRAVSQETGKRLGVGFMKRFATGYRMAQELTTRAEFGQVTHVSARISTGVWTPAWSNVLTPLAFVLDHSVHFMDLVQFFGGPVDWVCAAPSRYGDSRFGFAVVLGFRNGASGILEISNFESRGVPNERVQIMGSNGQSVSVDNVSRVTLGRDAEPMSAGRAFGIDTDRVMWEPNMTNISAENSSLVHMGYVGEMRNLASSILGGTALDPSIDDGIAALALAHAVLASNGQRVDLSSQ